MRDEQIALARRVVACKGWRWMPGMRWWTDDDRGRLDDFQPEYMGHPDGALPDLTDPATLGCLLELVRRAVSDPNAYVDYSFSEPTWYVNARYEYEGRDVLGVFAQADTEAEALVAALEAAP